MPVALVYVSKKHSYKATGSTVRVGHEVEYGSGDYRMYVTIEKFVQPSKENVEGSIHLRVPGRRSVVKVTPVEIGTAFK